MSHWVKVKTKVNDFALLKKALARMDLQYDEGNFTISQEDNSEQAQIRFTGGSSVKVGLAKQSDGTFAMVGDPYYTACMRKYYRGQQDFGAELNVAYAIEKAHEDLEAQSFYLAESEETEEELIMTWQRI